MKGWLQALAAAVQFLTRIPVPWAVPFTNEVLKRSTTFFPWAGLLIGFLVWGTGWGLALVLPAWPAAALTLFVAIALTGGLHLDGLMDTADGIFSHRSRERMLEIMKDSRVGAMGVIACVAVLILKWSLVATMMEAGQWQWGLAAVLPFIWSRYAMVWAMAREPYARPNEGLGGYFKGLGTVHLCGAGLMSVAASALVIWLWLQLAQPLHFTQLKQLTQLTERFTLATTHGQISPVLASLVLIATLAVAVSLLAWVCSRALSRKLGGLTGDTYGAINELIETAVLILITLIFVGKG
ncbi:adenosylcobinamide-GDP ribazoletransferase [Paenibacillus sp. 481]|nr:adenosylcobinamide-GDP ribazoletransferase [Paenibacillus sp. 481]